MGRKPKHYNHIIHTLQELQTKYPTYTMGMHIATALGDYRDFWGITDKEFLFALEKYKVQLELEAPLAAPEELDKIIKDGMDLSLSNVLGEDEEDEDIREQNIYE
jgi:hypothetical protein